MKSFKNSIFFKFTRVIRLRFVSDHHLKVCKYVKTPTKKSGREQKPFHTLQRHNSCQVYSTLHVMHVGVRRCTHSETELINHGNSKHAQEIRKNKQGPRLIWCWCPPLTAEHSSDSSVFSPSNDFNSTKCLIMQAGWNETGSYTYLYSVLVVCAQEWIISYIVGSPATTASMMPKIKQTGWVMALLMLVSLIRESLLWINIF